MTIDPFDAPLTDPAAPGVVFQPLGLDPFDEPLYDPTTGELLEPDGEVVDGVLEPEDGGSLLPAVIADQGIVAIPFAVADLPAFAGGLRRAFEERTAALYQRALDDRLPGKVTAAIVAPELRVLADAHETLDTIGKAFTEAARSAKATAGQVALEVATRNVEKEGGSTSVRVGSGSRDVKVTTTQPTEVFTDTPGIVDVLVAHLVGERPLDLPNQPEAFAAGARAMAETLLELLASPKWKSTALDSLARELDTPLAARLNVAYGRRPVGEVQVKIERPEPTSRSRAV